MRFPKKTFFLSLNSHQIWSMKV